MIPCQQPLIINLSIVKRLSATHSVVTVSKIFCFQRNRFHSLFLYLHFTAFTDMDYKAILKQYWGFDNFRGIQEDIINSIGNGQDTLGLMPTGGGKSVTFQVPALAMPGLCLVITPLIALMKDQVHNLRERGIKAAAVYSGMTREEIIVTLENCIFGNYKFLYISPERLGTEIFQAKLHYFRL